MKIMELGKTYLGLCGEMYREARDIIWNTVLDVFIVAARLAGFVLRMFTLLAKLVIGVIMLGLSFARFI